MTFPNRCRYNYRKYIGRRVYIILRNTVDNNASSYRTSVLQWPDGGADQSFRRCIIIITLAERVDSRTERNTFAESWRLCSSTRTEHGGIVKSSRTTDCAPFTTAFRRTFRITTKYSACIFI